MRVLALLAVFLISATEPPTEWKHSPNAWDFCEELAALGKTNRNAVGSLFDKHNDDLTTIAWLAVDLLEYELRHRKGCRFDPDRPRRHRCSCGLLSRIGVMKAALAGWEEKNP